MAVMVEFDDKLRERIGGAADIEVTATTVHGALLQVGRACPALHMFNCEGELRGTLRVQKNGAPVAVTEGVNDGDRIRLSVG